jgi:hypothetical protein
VLNYIVYSNMVISITKDKVKTAYRYIIRYFYKLFQIVLHVLILVNKLK